MATLWGGRFKKNTKESAFRFNESFSFDRRLYDKDIEGSIAHVVMLEKQHILTLSEKDEIVKGLIEIKKEIENIGFDLADSYEDIHSYIEAKLIEKIGDIGKKMHTGRSRNDQVALDMKLYIRDEISEIDAYIFELQKVLLSLIEEHIHTYMPGFTHMQKAQAITLSHHLGAYFEMLIRDRGRLNDIYKRMNYCPLGAGALAGTTLSLDREYVSSMLGFEGATGNSLDSVSDRDYLIELLDALSIIMMHLSRFNEEMITWNSNEYGFIELDDGYSTGSSIMPQKKNPDICELIRGKTGRVYGALMSMLTTMKGLPLAYNKDMQEDKEMTFDAIDTVKDCLFLFTEMLSCTSFNKDRMNESARGGYINATDVADYLTKRGIAFRDAHEIAGKITLKASDKGVNIEDLSIEEFNEISPNFDEDIYIAISLKTMVEKRLTKGSPSPLMMEEAILKYKEYLKN